MVQYAGLNKKGISSNLYFQYFVHQPRLLNKKKYVYAFFLLQKDFDTFHEPFFRDFPYFSVNIQFKFFIYRLIQSTWFKILEELVLFLYLSMQLDNGKWHTRVVMFYSLKPLLETK